MSDPLPTVLPSMTGEQIAALCERYSTPECEVCAVIESIAGHPVVRLARSYRELGTIQRQAGGL